MNGVTKWRTQKAFESIVKKGHGDNKTIADALLQECAGDIDARTRLGHCLYDQLLQADGRSGLCVSGDGWSAKGMERAVERGCRSAWRS
jgi:hypothetical protein